VLVIAAVVWAGLAPAPPAAAQSTESIRSYDVEIVIEGDNGQSFRFRAQGVWLKDDGDDYRVGLAFVGMPVCLHKVAVSRHEQDLVDRIVAAAA